MQTYQLTNEEKRGIQFVRLVGALALLKNEKRTTTYDALGRAIGLFAGSSQFTHLLGKIMREDQRNNKGYRCALVVSEKTGLPGEGFFALAEEVRGKKFIDERERINFWKDTKNRVFSEDD